MKETIANFILLGPSLTQYAITVMAECERSIFRAALVRQKLTRISINKLH